MNITPDLFSDAGGCILDCPRCHPVVRVLVDELCSSSIGRPIQKFFYRGNCPKCNWRLVVMVNDG